MSTDTAQSRKLKRKPEESEEGKGPIEKRAREEAEDDDDELEGKEEKKKQRDEEEQWRRCRDQDGKDLPLEASTFGRVRSTTTGHIYANTTVLSGGKVYFTPRLVCLCYNGDPPKKDSRVCHRDEDISNNRPSNLKWSDRYEINSATAEKRGCPVYYIDEKGTRRDFPTQLAAAEAIGVSRRQIVRSVRNGHTIAAGLRVFPKEDEKKYTDATEKGEQWAVVGEEGYSAYEVSNKGRLRNKSRGWFLRPTRQAGYMHVNLLSSSNEKKMFRVHRLVAQAFLGTPPTEEHQVDHINGQRDDNRIENLRWATGKENMSYALGIPVYALDEDGDEMHFISIRAAARWLVDNAGKGISAAKAGISASLDSGKPFGGFTWNRKSQKASD